MSESIECHVTDRSTGDRGMGSFRAAPGCVPSRGDLLVFFSPIYGHSTVPITWKVDDVQWHVPSRPGMVLDSVELICVPAPGPFWPDRQNWMPRDDDESDQESGVSGDDQDRQRPEEQS